VRYAVCGARKGKIFASLRFVVRKKQELTYSDTKEPRVTQRTINSKFETRNSKLETRNAKRQTLNDIYMSLNFRLIARNLVKGKSYAILNVVGLSIGFACAFAVIVWIKNEFSYDKYLPDSDRTYRLTFETASGGIRVHFARCWENWVTQMPYEFPQIEELVRLSPYRHTALKVDENKFYSDRVFASDSNFFKVFGIDLLTGDSKTILNQPYSAVISSSVAARCFGKNDPIGKTILLSGEYDTKLTAFTVKGVMRDTPVNSHIHFDVITSFVNPLESPDWAYVYLLLKRNVKPEEIIAQLPAFIKTHEKESSQKTFTPYLQKITDIHLYSNKDREVEPNGNIYSVYLFALIALVLLLISWVNFYNLNTARIFLLQKQISILRIVGSDNRQIIDQTIAESTALVVASLLLASILIDSYGQLANSLSGSGQSFRGFSNLIGVLPFVIIIGLFSVMAGTLPIILHVYRTKNSISGSKKIQQKDKLNVSSYGILMTFQFALSTILMIAAITIYLQKEFILSGNLGNMSSDILVFKKLNWEIRYKYNAFRNSALQGPLIKSITASMEEPSGETADAMQVESPAIDESHKGKSLYVLPVEDNFLSFFNIPLVAGNTFPTFNPDLKREYYILNESAVRFLGWTSEEAIGRPLNIKFDSPDIFYGGTVVGVVRDFNFTTLKQEIKPYVLFQKPIFYITFLVKIDSAHKKEAVQGLKKIWDQELPDYPFQYEFLNDLYKSTYSKELNQSKLTSFFSILALIIICLGLLSVTSVLVTRRTKEIGIRKVNGSNVFNLLFMLNSDFINWFIIAFVIACPIAWYLMNKWLQNFVYRTEIKWWEFAVSGMLVLLVTVLTVTIQCWRSATRNPVESLRYE
jgi:putative ABC transport system permease protein